MTEDTKRKFGTVKRPTIMGDFWQYTLEQFYEYKGFQRLGLILLGLFTTLFLVAYFSAIVFVAISLIPVYFVVNYLVGKSRRKNYSLYLKIPVKHKKVHRQTRIGDNYDIQIDTIETKTDVADVKLIPEKIIAGGNKMSGGINTVNIVERRLTNGRKLYIAEADSLTDEGEDVEDVDIKKRQKGTVTIYGSPDESYGNIALLTAVSGITIKVKPKFEKQMKKIEEHGLVDPSDIARIRSDAKKVWELIDQANNIIYSIQEEIQAFPFDPIDVESIKRKHERQFLVGMGKWKGEWAEKMERLGAYKQETADTLMPHMLSLAEQANIISQKLIEMELFSKQMMGRATLSSLKELLEITGYDSGDLKRVIEVEVKRKGLIPTQEVEEEKMVEEEEAEE